MDNRKKGKLDRTRPSPTYPRPSLHSTLYIMNREIWKGKSTYVVCCIEAMFRIFGSGMGMGMGMELGLGWRWELGLGWDWD